MDRCSCPAYTSGSICPLLLLIQNVNPPVALYCLLALDSTACASEYNRCFWLSLRVIQTHAQLKCAPSLVRSVLGTSNADPPSASVIIRTPLARIEFKWNLLVHRESRAVLVLSVSPYSNSTGTIRDPRALSAIQTHVFQHAIGCWTSYLLFGSTSYAFLLD
jgi:hypothetical protein